MATTVFTQVGHVQETGRISLLKKFFAWCKAQEENRLIWLGVVLAVHGCLLTPLTFGAIAYSGLNLTLVYVVIGAMAATLIPNLAAMPTKVTLPIFFLSVLVDVVVLIYCATLGFSASNVY